MNSWREGAETGIATFLKVAELAGDPISRTDLVSERLAARHRPPTRLPAGRIVVYGFWGDKGWLNVGKARAKLQSALHQPARYDLGSALSTLAGSLLNDPHMLTVAGFDSKAPGVRIKAATHRVSVSTSASRQEEVLSLLEAFLHPRLKPRYEG